MKKKIEQTPEHPAGVDATTDIEKHKLNGGVCEFCGVGVVCPVNGTK